MKREIEEIAIEAGYKPYVYEEAVLSDEPWELTIDLDKFAELIILKCANLAYESWVNQEVSRGISPHVAIEKYFDLSTRELSQKYNIDIPEIKS